MTADIIETEVDGIRTFLVKSSFPRPHAGLVFRVGWADETLPTRGITHLVEHLALHEHGAGDLHYNGSTADTFTHFHVEGEPEEIARYLNGVCSALRALPVQRLETEKEILRVEANKRYRPSVPAWRFGPQGYGLSTYPELGLRAITADRAQDWADSRFTRQNAVLWMTTDVLPGGLDLRLTEGPAHPFPDVTSALPELPAFYVGGSDEIIMTSVVERSTAASIFASVFHLQLFRDLRQLGGYSYSPSAGYQPRDAHDATVHAYADLTGESHDAATGAFVDVLATMRLGASDPEFLERSKREATTALSQDDAVAYRLPGYAMNVLSGHENLTQAEYLSQVQAVTPDDIAAVGAAVTDSALIEVPQRGIEWAGFAEAPVNSSTRLSGKQLHHRGRHGDVLVLSKDGVSREIGESRSTVLFSDTAAMLSYPDGGRVLMGADGFQVAVEPGEYPVSREDAARIDESVARDAVILMPPRADEDVPRATTPPRANHQDRRFRVSRSLFASKASAIWFGILAFILLRIIVALLTGGPDTSDDNGLRLPEHAEVTVIPSPQLSALA